MAEKRVTMPHIFVKECLLKEPEVEEKFAELSS